MNNNITHRQVMDRAGNRIEPPPMATYCEPSKRAIARAKGAALSQREQRERAEALRLLAATGFELQPPAPEMPAKLALHQEEPLQPDPQFAPAYLQSLLLGILLGGAAALLFEAGRP